MARDCFSNETSFPPSISDDFASIERFRPIPFVDRYAYHLKRTAAMTGAGTLEAAWDAYWDLVKRLPLPLETNAS